MGSGAEPRPKTNLVHSKAARKPLVAIILDILSTMFYAFEEIHWRWCRHNTVPLSHIMSTVSDGVMHAVRRSKGWGGAGSKSATAPSPALSFPLLLPSIRARKLHPNRGGCSWRSSSLLRPFLFLLSYLLPLPSEVCPLNPARESGECCKLCSGVWGRAPAEVEFGAF